MSHAARAVVLGGTGHLGNALTRALLTRGYEVRVISRRATPSPNLAGLAVQFVPARWGLADALDQQLRGASLLVDAAGPYASEAWPSQRTATRRHLQDARERTRVILSLVAKHQVTLAYVSSFTTLMRDAGTPLRHAVMAANRFLHPYFELKRVVEQDLVQAARAGLPVAIVNPTLCIGPWDGRPREQCFLASIARGEAPWVADASINTVDVRDVAEALLCTVTEGRFGEPRLVAGDNGRLVDLHRGVAKLAGAASPTFPVPLLTLWAACYWLEQATRSCGVSPPIPALAPALLCEYPAWGFPDTARAILGSRRSLDVSLRDALSWYRQVGYC